LNELNTLASKSNSLVDFKEKVMANYEKFRDEIARQSKDYTAAEVSRLKNPLDDIYNKANKK
tara:strand:- start:445 stop:630 length:186 start_codon:yes stop_codon:yes gene_type:complete